MNPSNKCPCAQGFTAENRVPPTPERVLCLGEQRGGSCKCLLFPPCRALSCFEGGEPPIFCTVNNNTEPAVPCVSVCLLEGQAGNVEVLFPDGFFLAGPRLLPDALQL